MGLISLTWKTKITQPNRALTSISQLVSHWRAWESRRRDLEILAQDDGMLSDIGLSRSDVLAACNQPFWRDPRKWLAARAEERQAAVCSRQAEPEKVSRRRIRQLRVITSRD
jgi:uncharacterized protein YjiS (DUF1127 family)